MVALRADDVVSDGFVVEHDGVLCMEQRGNGACVALDPVTQLCTFYEARPQTCREFGRGEVLCRQILGQPATSTGFAPPPTKARFDSVSSYR